MDIFVFWEQMAFSQLKLLKKVMILRSSALAKLKNDKGVGGLGEVTEIVNDMERVGWKKSGRITESRSGRTKFELKLVNIRSNSDPW